LENKAPTTATVDADLLNKFEKSFKENSIKAYTEINSLTKRWLQKNTIGGYEPNAS
jgi:hypothetical protein